MLANKCKMVHNSHINANDQKKMQTTVPPNPAAEYAALMLMQARAAEEAGGGAQEPAQFSGMQQMGMKTKRSVDGRGFDAGAMAHGYAPRGDPAAAYADMMQAQTAPALPAQSPMMQPDDGVWEV